MKEKFIIALYGSANTGKTSTLLMLVDLLRDVAVSFCKKDNRMICELCGYYIAITTAGDDVYNMRQNVDFMEESDWNIAITATRTKGKTREVISDYAREIGAEILWVPKSKAEGDFDGCNLKQATELSDTINSIIIRWNATASPTFISEPNPAGGENYVVSREKTIKGDFCYEPLKGEVYLTEEEAKERARELNQEHNF